MSLVDDTAEVRWHGGIITKELLDNFLWDGQDIVVDCLLAQQVIRCNASLSRIQELTPQQAFHGHADIARAVYVRRAETSSCMLFKILGGAGRGKKCRRSLFKPFAAELQDDGCEMLICGLSNYLADAASSSVEYDVVPLLQQGCRLGNSAGNDFVAFLRGYNRELTCQRSKKMGNKCNGQDLRRPDIWEWDR